MICARLWEAGSNWTSSPTGRSGSFRPNARREEFGDWIRIAQAWPIQESRARRGANRFLLRVRSRQCRKWGFGKAPTQPEFSHCLQQIYSPFRAQNREFCVTETVCAPAQNPPGRAWRVPNNFLTLIFFMRRKRPRGLFLSLDGARRNTSP